MSDDAEAFPVGTRVRVKKSVVVYHHPEHRNQPFDVLGLEGTVEAVVQEWEGRPVSANLPYQVKFYPKFKGHFQASELETLP
ncbi:ferredoxin--nitrite reductase [Neosynechococcus sphagnicola sy1]|uniref:Ferredoxin--nitrite reductase n=1 Tax=Neosynechococcus sphagnicola sy1 TaxID=1497020 RepID=A0A098TLM8_9CYAN|nr:ferredoxin-thioredoxin reductase variable chain [Neosynechococcus sphagnicola]KGF72777.1 ferredoxin--nitrite reductase [Neosynechococcus sphagnicola sy1]